VTSSGQGHFSSLKTPKDVKLYAVPMLLSEEEWRNLHPFSYDALADAEKSISILMGPTKLLGGVGECRAVLFRPAGGMNASGVFTFHPEPFNHPSWAPLYYREFPDCDIRPETPPGFMWPLYLGKECLAYELEFQCDGRDQLALEIHGTLRTLKGICEQACIMIAEEVAVASCVKVGKN